MAVLVLVAPVIAERGPSRPNWQVLAPASSPFPSGAGTDHLSLLWASDDGDKLEGSDYVGFETATNAITAGTFAVAIVSFSTTDTAAEWLEHCATIER